MLMDVTPLWFQLDFVSFLAWKQGPQVLQVNPGKDTKQRKGEACS